MPKPPVPPHLDDFLKQPNPSVIASLRPDGSPHTAATWYLWEDGRVVVNMDVGRQRLEYLRSDPRVSITVLGGEGGWYRHVTLVGRVASFEDDSDLDVIDRLSKHYMGSEYGQRDRGRVTAVIEVESYHSWAGGQPWEEPAS